MLTLAFQRPPIDWHAAAPELTLLAFGALLTVVDIAWLRRGRAAMSALASIGLLAAMVPVLTLAWDGTDRSMFGGAYMVDDYALVMKAVFLLSGYVVVLMSVDYIAEGDYWESEYYQMLLSAVLGMAVMASARDLITIFVALELLSIPAYLMATWRKRDLRSNEAGLKYYLMGVFASAVLLYGMSLLYGGHGFHDARRYQRGGLGRCRRHAAGGGDAERDLHGGGLRFSKCRRSLSILGRPTPTRGPPRRVTAFLSVASKAAGFVALLSLVFVGFWERADVYQPLLWALAAASMFGGNLMALRQTNVVRMLAYSGVAQAGYMLAPLAVAGESPAVADDVLTAVVTYLAIYAAMNLGAFVALIAIARRTASAELHSYKGLFQYSPALAVAMTVFLMALAGIPAARRLVRQARDRAGSDLARHPRGSGDWQCVVAVNSVIALYYYARIASYMWVENPTEAGDFNTTSHIKIPASISTALLLTGTTTLAFGITPQWIGHFTQISLLTSQTGN